MNDSLQKLADKSEIQDVMLRYCRGVDRRDWELVRSTFFEDGYDDHAEFHGTRDQFIAWVSERHNMPSALKSSHMLSNCLIEFATPELALVETYFTARLELAPDKGGHRQMLAGGGKDDDSNLSIEVLGRYIDRFEKRSGEWREVRRRTVFDSMKTQALAGGDPRNPEWLLGTRDKQDPLHVAKAEVLAAGKAAKEAR